MKSKDNLKIVVGVNSLVSTTQAAYGNHCQMWYKFGKYYRNIEFCFVNPSRMTIDRMRNLAAETTLDIQADYLLFIDDDVLIPQPFDFLEKLIKLDVDIAAADVLIRGYPFKHMIFQWDKAHLGLIAMDNIPKKKGPLKCGAVGFSVCLIKRSLIEKVSKPYFVTGPMNTEDIYFCVKAEKEYPQVQIVTDTSISCGHILWSEIIESGNKKNYKKYWEAQYGKPDQKADRGIEYLGRVQETLARAKAATVGMPGTRRL